MREIDHLIPSGQRQIDEIRCHAKLCKRNLSQKQPRCTFQANRALPWARFMIQTRQDIEEMTPTNPLDRRCHPASIQHLHFRCVEGIVYLHYAYVRRKQNTNLLRTAKIECSRDAFPRFAFYISWRGGRAF